MTLELTAEQHTILRQTSKVDTPAQFQALLKAATPAMEKVVRGGVEPNQPLPTTLTELRDLALSIHVHSAELKARGYGDDKRSAFFAAIRLLDTAHAWFGEGVRTGAFRARSVEEVVQASRPWRARLKAFGEHAFVFEPEIAELFGDANSTGTIEEEIEDLSTLNDLVKQHHAKLESVGMDAAFVHDGATLLAEARGRDLLAILGLRNRAEAALLRNRVVTYAVALGREARAAGVNACYDQADARRRFEAASFRDALRQLRPRRGGSAATTDAEPTTSEGEGGTNGAAPSTPADRPA